MPEVNDISPAGRLAARVLTDEIHVTPVGHATFLIQMDALNVLTDPIWSNRCSPVPWVGPKRHLQPGIRFDELPPIDVELVSPIIMTTLTCPLWNVSRKNRRLAPSCLWVISTLCGMQVSRL